MTHTPLAIGQRRVCIVGSGPAGFYCAKYLLRHSPLCVHILERLQLPYGLVRYGVAPDHPEVKHVQNDFARVAAHLSVRLFTGTELGKHIQLSELRRRYDAVVLAHGANGDRTLGIPGECEYTMAARAFVGWYNGHPDFVSSAHADISTKLRNTESAVVFGVGNVALDIARILVKEPHDLESTDISAPALSALHQSRIRRVHLIGRRGPPDAAFTIKEFRELATLPNVQVRFHNVHRASSDGDDDAFACPSDASRAVRRKLDLMRKIHESTIDDNKDTTAKQVIFHFHTSPLSIDASNGIVFTDDDTLGSSSGIDPRIAADNGLIITSIGYRHEPFENTRGRIERGLYVSGWARRGPTGIIGTNIVDAKEVVQSVIDDFATVA